MVTIRVASVTDAEQLLEIYRPYVEQTAITFEYTVPTIEEFRNRIATTLQKYPYLVAEQEGNIVGYAYVSPFKTRAAYAWAVETSIYLKREYRGRGIGKRLYLALEDCVQQLGILNMNACIAYPEKEDEFLNKDSVKFHEHLGYTIAGTIHQCGQKFNHWYDIVWMEKQIGEHTENPPKIKVFQKNMLRYE